MIRRHYLFLFLSLLLIAGMTAVSQAYADNINKEVKVCDHNGEWPPYTYFKRESGVTDKSGIEGATIELMEEVFKRIGLKHSITMMPWIRCLYEVDHFSENKKYEVFINGSYNEERASKYYITSALYKTHHALFYSTIKFKTPPVVDSPSNLVGYTFCGILGYNYAMYRKAGLINTIDTGAEGLAAVLEKVTHERCDFFPSPMEPILAGKRLGMYDYSEVISAIKIPWAGTTTFHAFIAKSSPRAFELYTKINQQIQILQSSGKSDEIFKKWLEEGDGL